MKTDERIKWLLNGDVSIQYQVHRDLLFEERDDLRKRIATEGWGAEILSKRKPNKHWGKGYYSPKWISSHYSILDLRNMWFPAEHPLVRETIDMILKNEKGSDGGINPSGHIKESDVCMNGMMLNCAAFFGADEEDLKSVIDFILDQTLPDGGFNCQFNRSGAKHSSLHSTLSVAEGFFEYEKNGYLYRSDELKKARKSAEEFILMHQLFISDRTGEIIKQGFLKFPYPPRWKYDILKALDYFRYSGAEWDDRMQPAIDILLKKQNKDGTWNQYAEYSGLTHFTMDQAGKPGRWNTLRAMRVLKHFGIW
ncbi:prenyltransferase/squalene oxidase repeat-containing protein [Rhodohalobacter sp. 614A]|uniref:prenyltransferase/squalene oxidase repeat-containing protein n=1 Tax=Rhodohalobacter sp. 614A TaxID=2908649 RepID=UPI001F224C0D|nr:prenyltransferase/squalene oxidase repeat-containing protein [Rhodohalobacter sp. 614A]